MPSVKRRKSPRKSCSLNSRTFKNSKVLHHHQNESSSEETADRKLRSSSLTHKNISKVFPKMSLSKYQPQELNDYDKKFVKESILGSRNFHSILRTKPDIFIDLAILKRSDLGGKLNHYLDPVRDEDGAIIQFLTDDDGAMCREFQMKLALNHIESVKSGKFKVFQNRELRSSTLLHHEIDVSDREVNLNLGRKHYACPFLLNIPEQIEEHHRKMEKELVGNNSEDEDEQFFNHRSSPTRRKPLDISNPLQLKQPVTLEMITEDPAAHGLGPEIAEYFDEGAEVVDVAVKMGGKKRVTKCFKAGTEVVFPCSGKNCKHKRVDEKSVRVFREDSPPVIINHKRKSSEAPDLSPPPKKQSVGDDEYYNSSSSDELDPELMLTPTILSVTSLAPPVSRLSPLASQLPNPVPMPRRIRHTRPKIQEKKEEEEEEDEVEEVEKEEVVKEIQNNNVPPTVVDGKCIMPIVLTPSNNCNRRKSNPKLAGSPAACTYVTIGPGSSRQAEAKTGALTASQLKFGVVSKHGGVVSKPPPLLACPEVITCFSDSDEEEGGGREEVDTKNSNESSSSSSTQPPPNVSTDEATQISRDQESLIETLDGDEVEILETFPPPPVLHHYSVVRTDVNGGGGGRKRGEGVEREEKGPTITISNKIFEEDGREESLVVQGVGGSGRATKNNLIVARIVKRIGNVDCICCQVCGKTFPLSCEILYVQHMRSKHAIEVNIEEKKESKEVEVQELHKCKVCEQLLSKDEKLEHHTTCCPDVPIEDAFGVMMLSGPKKKLHLLFCGLCEQSFDSRIGLRQHLTGFHRDIWYKVILDPHLRCSVCLSKFDDSVHLTLHVSKCVSQRASEETLAELAKAVLYCDVCSKNHSSIGETQSCYTRTGLLRCVLCLHSVVSRPNFFHHLKTYHMREGNSGLHCPFCTFYDRGMRECFEHIMDEHYSPYLEREGLVSKGGKTDAAQVSKPPVKGYPGARSLKTTPGPTPHLTPISLSQVRLMAASRSPILRGGPPPPLLRPTVISGSGGGRLTPIRPAQLPRTPSLTLQMPPLSFSSPPPQLGRKGGEEDDDVVEIVETVSSPISVTTTTTTTTTPISAPSSTNSPIIETSETTGTTPVHKIVDTIPVITTPPTLPSPSLPKIRIVPAHLSARPQEGAPFKLITVASGGKFVPIRPANVRGTTRFVVSTGQLSNLRKITPVGGIKGVIINQKLSESPSTVEAIGSKPSLVSSLVSEEEKNENNSSLKSASSAASIIKSLISD